jgi:hypothetical protein
MTLKGRQKELILRALTDPKFRKSLSDNPRVTLGLSRMSPANEKEVAMLLAAVKGIEAQISALADELLCAGGGGCGIARG